MNELTEPEKAAIKKLLLSDPVRLLMGAEEWDLTEDEEVVIWNVIRRLEAE